VGARKTWNGLDIGKTDCIKGGPFDAGFLKKGQTLEVKVEELTGECFLVSKRDPGMRVLGGLGAGVGKKRK